MKLNFEPREIGGDRIDAHYQEGVHHIENPWKGVEYGWPKAFRKEVISSEELISPNVSDIDLGKLKYVYPGSGILYGKLFTNLFYCFLIAFAIAVVCERIIRRTLPKAGKDQDADSETRQSRSNVS